MRVFRHENVTEINPATTIKYQQNLKELIVKIGDEFYLEIIRIYKGLKAIDFIFHALPQQISGEFPILKW
jgi:hypothetical protein